MQERFIENGIEYVKQGDYYFPNLSVPNDKEYNIGKYGRLHAKFIKKHILAVLMVIVGIIVGLFVALKNTVIVYKKIYAKKG